MESTDVDTVILVTYGNGYGKIVQLIRITSRHHMRIRKKNNSVNLDENLSM